MSTPAQESPQPLTAADVEQWMCMIDERRFHLYPKLVGTPAQVEVFWEMADLLQEAIEEVRVISAQSREESQAIRAKGQALRDHSAQLLERSTAAMERCAPFTPPRPEAIRQAESQMLEIFKHGLRRKDAGG
jgi:hypothetical protein